MCGRREALSDAHKDYEKISKNPKITYICEGCLLKVQNEASSHNKPKKPIS
jgi:uncharacterized protein YlaI